MTRKFLIVLLLAAKTAFAQNYAFIDSVSKVLLTAKDDSNKVNLLLSLSENKRFLDLAGEEEYKISQTSKALSTVLQLGPGRADSQIAQLALNISQKLNWKSGIARSYFELSNYVKTSTSIEYLYKAYDVAENYGNTQLMLSCLWYLEMQYQSVDNYTKVLELSLQYQQICKQYNLDKNLVFGIAQTARIYSKVKNDSKALEYFNLELETAIKNRDTFWIAGAYSELASYHSDRGELDKAINLIHRSIEITKGRDHKTDAYAEEGFYKELASYYLQQKKYDSAIFWRIAAYNSYKKAGYKDGMAASLVYIGYCYKTMRNYDTALLYFKDALSMAEESESKFNLYAIENVLGGVYLEIAKDTSNSLPAGKYYAKTKTENLHTALSYFDKIFAAHKESVDVFPQYIETLKALGEVAKANKAYEEYVSLLNEQASENEKNKIANLEITREVNEMERTMEMKKMETRHQRIERLIYIFGFCLLGLVTLLIARSYKVQRGLNKTISELVSKQDIIIIDRTRQLEVSNTKLLHANHKLVELIQYNAHNMREPLTRVMGAMDIHNLVSSQEFYDDIWPQMRKAVDDLDNSIKQVITIADESIELYG